MTTPRNRIVDLEKRFWQSMIDNDTDTALALMTEPSTLVSAYGTMKFDHADYRRMAEKGDMIVKSFEFSDVDVQFPNDDTAIATYKVKQATARRGDSRSTTQQMADSSTWIRGEDGQWRCILHTETALQEMKKPS